MKALLFLCVAATILNLLAIIAAIIIFMFFGGVNLFLPKLGLIISLDFFLILFLMIIEIILVTSSILWFRYQNFLK